MAKAPALRRYRTCGALKGPSSSSSARSARPVRFGASAAGRCSAMSSLSGAKRLSPRSIVPLGMIASASDRNEPPNSARRWLSRAVRSIWVVRSSSASGIPPSRRPISAGPLTAKVPLRAARRNRAIDNPERLPISMPSHFAQSPAPFSLNDSGALIRVSAAITPPSGASTASLRASRFFSGRASSTRSRRSPACPPGAASVRARAVTCARRSAIWAAPVSRKSRRVPATAGPATSRSIRSCPISISRSGSSGAPGSVTLKAGTRCSTTVGAMAERMSTWFDK